MYAFEMKTFTGTQTRLSVCQCGKDEPSQHSVPQRKAEICGSPSREQKQKQDDGSSQQCSQMDEPSVVGCDSILKNI